MTTVVNGHDTALWPADAAPDAAARRPAEAASRPTRAGAHRAGDLVWARICWSVTVVGTTGVLMLLSVLAYRSVA